MIDFRLSLGDYFADKSAKDIPEDLVWEDGMDEPEIGDSRASKGGVFRTWMPQFPATVRPFGKESNNSFRGYLYDELEIGLVNMHPLTGKIIPGVAKRWAVSADKRTVYYELDEEHVTMTGRRSRRRIFKCLPTFGCLTMSPLLTRSSITVSSLPRLRSTVIACSR